MKTGWLSPDPRLLTIKFSYLAPSKLHGVISHIKGRPLHALQGALLSSLVVGNLAQSFLLGESVFLSVLSEVELDLSHVFWAAKTSYAYSATNSTGGHLQSPHEGKCLQSLGLRSLVLAPKGYGKLWF